MNIHEHGIEIKKNVISAAEITNIKNELSNTVEAIPSYGIRSADKKFQSIHTLSSSTDLIKLAGSILGSVPNIVRVIYFDKTPDKNWLVTWHQDKTIALDKKVNIKSWGPWSIKDNIHHVQPSIDVLRKMVSFRLHLDDADENNGCLKVIPKSHQLGFLSQAQIVEIVNKSDVYACEVDAGDLLMIKPLLLHSSSKSMNPLHRRVIHIEYSNYLLPENLKWA